MSDEKITDEDLDDLVTLFAIYGDDRTLLMEAWGGRSRTTVRYWLKKLGLVTEDRRAARGMTRAQEEQFVKDYVSKTTSLVEASKVYGVNRRTLVQILQKRGHQPRTGGGWGRETCRRGHLRTDYTLVTTMRYRGRWRLQQDCKACEALRLGKDLPDLEYSRKRYAESLARSEKYVQERNEAIDAEKGTHDDD